MKSKYFWLILFFIVILSSLAYAEEVCEADSGICEVDPIDDSIDYSGLVNVANDIHNEDELCIIYFYSDGCSHCAATEPFLKDMEEKYKGEIQITKYEVSHNLENYQMYNEYCGVQNIPLNERGIPLIAIGDRFLMGEDQIKDNLEAEIELLLESEERVCPISEMTCHLVTYNETDVDPINPGLGDKKITLPLILITGFIDGINPCAFAVLIFLLTFLIEISATKKRMIKAGIGYIIAVYITYFLAGIGLLSAIQVSGISALIVKIAAAVAIAAGLINIKDYFWYGKGFTLAIPESKKGIIEKWTRKGNLLAAIVLGFLVSMFELPCTGGVYLAILAMLANTVTKLQAIGYLLIYNIMFVLPLVVILGLLAFGMKAEHVENWRTSKKNLMKLVLGILLLGLGIAMLIGVI